MLTPSDFRKIEEIRRNLAVLRREADDIRRYLALKANFNPNQPRVPAGNPDGGQWTSGGGGSGSGSRGPAAGGAAAHEGVPTWHTVSTRRRAGGTVVEETVVGSDGTSILSELSVRPERTGWHERHTVLAPDGTIRTFENSGRTQTVFDGDGRRLSEVRLTDGGFERQPIVQPAFAPAAVPAATATVELALTLYTWLSTRNTLGSQAVVAFSARHYRPNAAGALDLDYVGTLSREEVDAACPRHGEVQIRTDMAAASVRRRDDWADLSPQQIGTAVHVDLQNQIRGLSNPNFRAEVSVLKTRAAAEGPDPDSSHQERRYGYPGTVRIDVLENRSDATVCVYDIKTEKTTGLAPGRSAEISRAVFFRYPRTQRIIVTEVRPTAP